VKDYQRIARFLIIFLILIIFFKFNFNYFLNFLILLIFEFFVNRIVGGCSVGIVLGGGFAKGVFFKLLNFYNF
jgi:hypothetical protein